jgi:outer membrane murein-binding lipoprotein Lpp
LQLSIDDARAHLRAKLASDARRLAASSAATVAEINAANAEADAARERADQLAAERQAALDSAENMIYSYGELRLKIQAVRALALSDADEKAIAESALNFFVLKNADPSARNVSGFVTTATDLALRYVLTPHIAGFVAPLEAKCKEIAANVRALAAENKICLRTFVKTLTSETHRHQSGKLSDSKLYSGLLE